MRSANLVAKGRQRAPPRGVTTVHADRLASRPPMPTLNKCRVTKVRWQSDPTADYARADGEMSGVTTGPAGTSPRGGDSAKTGGGRCRGTACQWCAGGAQFCRRNNGAAGSQASKVLRRCRQMDAEHADGPESGMRVHGKPPVRIPGRNADAVALVPSACSACICLHPRKTLLAWRRAARRRKRGDRGRYARSQNPMHQGKHGTM